MCDGWNVEAAGRTLVPGCSSVYMMASGTTTLATPGTMFEEQVALAVAACSAAADKMADKAEWATVRRMARNCRRIEVSVVHFQEADHRPARALAMFFVTAGLAR